MNWRRFRLNWRRFRPLPTLIVGIIIILVIGVSLFFQLGGNTARNTGADFFEREEMLVNQRPAQVDLPTDSGEQFVNAEDGRVNLGDSILGPPQSDTEQQGQNARQEEHSALIPIEGGVVGSITQQRDAIERMIIKNGELALRVENVREAEAALGAQVAALGGYIVQVEMYGADEQMTANITFRVPAERFDEALTKVQELSKKVLSRTVSGDDVTEEFVDLQARLGNLEATRDRLRVLLEQAIEVEDALEVNLALSNVQGEIEQIQGRMEYLQQNAALSTVNVYLSPVPSIITQDSWQPLVVARNALRSLVELGQGLVNLAIVLLIWTPAWLPLLLFGWWGWRRLRRNHRSGAGPTAPTTA